MTLINDEPAVVRADWPEAAVEATSRAPAPAGSPADCESR